MKISIVTISLNQASFIEQAIESVLEQNYPDVEYIIVDAGSTDGSREIIEQYRERLASVIFEPDDGPADGLNKGFAKATGDIFFYLNADDYLLPSALLKAAKSFKEMPEVDVIYGNGLLVDKMGRSVKRLFGNKWNLTAFVYGAVSIIQQSTFIRKSAFKRSGMFNKNNRTCWDTELMVDLALSGCAIKYVPESYGAFRVYDGSITGSGTLRLEIVKELKRLRKEVLKQEPKLPEAFLFFYYRLVKNMFEPLVILKKLKDCLVPPLAK